MKKLFKLTLVLAVIFSLSLTSGALLGKMQRFIQPLLKQEVRIKLFKDIMRNLFILDFRTKTLKLVYYSCRQRGP